MISKVCSLVGHRRHKRRARPHLETWRSECVRCGVPMVRSAPGLWTAAPTLCGFAKSVRAKGTSDGLPYPEPKKQQPPKENGVADNNFSDFVSFPYEFASAMTADRSRAADRVPAADSREHYLARGVECRRLAGAAADRTIELIHLDMANRYDILARQAEDERRQLHVVR